MGVVVRKILSFPIDSRKLVTDLNQIDLAIKGSQNCDKYRSFVKASDKRCIDW